MSKHCEFHTDVSQGGKYFQLTFITNDKYQFLEMQKLARKMVDQSTPPKRWIRILHEVHSGRYSMRNRNWDEYECPECGNRQEKCTPCCESCRIQLQHWTDTRRVED